MRASDVSHALFASTAVALATAVFSFPALAESTSPTTPLKVPALIEPLVSRNLKVVVDTSGAPDCQAWAQRAKEMVELWHPIVSAYLDAPLNPGEKEVQLVFKEMKGVAATSKNVITIASGWVKSHPDDLGMVLHELVHVIQDYPPTQSVWLMEGIADYIRFWMAEPEGQPKQFNRAKENYRNGYRTTGAFLAWIEKQYKTPIVRDANLALRRGTYKDSLFEEKTGKNLDALWTEFMDSLEKAKPEAKRPI
ncbi:basic secretory protein-like protein [Verrucomicrobium sp. BvORR034]|uniref:basic secretory protein-like protein n=1 Tax=Verrucomicrobium sp. BvORR034 TaxID=1396418 RepID=UPI000678B3A9|nr:basic secretory protein-like protein [Verrucomicrobium sp. BvORR034]